MSLHIAFCPPAPPTTYPTPNNAALPRQKRRHFRLAPSASQSTYPAMYNGSLPRPTCHHIRTHAVFIDWYPAPLDTMSVSAKFTRLLLCGASAQALNLIASRAAKSKCLATRRPIKFYAERSKSARTSSRKSPIWRRNLAPGRLKKPLFSYKLVK